MVNPKTLKKNELNLNEHHVLFYRDFIDKYKVNTQLHFLNNMFFFGLYVFKNLTEHELQKIIQIISKKYLLYNTLINFEKFDSASIYDQFGNKIQLKHAVNSSVSYVAGDKIFLENVLKGISLNSEMAIKAEEDSLKKLYEIL